jgi:hypothetical protein
VLPFVINIRNPVTAQCCLNVTQHPAVGGVSAALFKIGENKIFTALYRFVVLTESVATWLRYFT